MTLRQCATAAAIAGILATGLGAGCGGSADDEPTFASQQVVDHVYRRGGVQLVRSPGSPPGIDILVPPAELADAYGRFEIYVVRRKDRDETLERLLGDAEPDERGIYWVRDQNAGWVAATKYGSNVVVAWLDAPGNGQVTEKWTLLHELLSSLPERRSKEA